MRKIKICDDYNLEVGKKFEIRKQDFEKRKLNQILSFSIYYFSSKTEISNQ